MNERYPIMKLKMLVLNFEDHGTNFLVVISPNVSVPISAL